MARHKEFDPEAALERAMEVFRTRGYEAASTSTLVEQMGVGRGSLYETFGTKHELLVAALHRYRERTFGRMIGRLDRSPHPIQEICNIYSAIGESHADGNVHGCLMVNCTIELGPHDDVVADYLRQGWKQLEEAFARALSRAQTAGELSCEKDPSALAGFLVTVMRGMGVGTKLGISHTEAENVASIVESILR